MNEDFVTYELAVKLKEKGFNEPCYGYYHTNKGDESIELCGNGDADFLNSINFHRVAAPTISQVLKWLIEEQNMFVCIDFFLHNGGSQIWWTVRIEDMKDETAYCLLGEQHSSYEQAALAGIEYVLDNLI